MTAATQDRLYETFAAIILNIAMRRSEELGESLDGLDLEGCEYLASACDPILNFLTDDSDIIMTHGAVFQQDIAEVLAEDESVQEITWRKLSDIFAEAREMSQSDDSVHP